MYSYNGITKQCKKKLWTALYSYNVVKNQCTIKMNSSTSYSVEFESAVGHFSIKNMC